MESLLYPPKRTLRQPKGERQAELVRQLAKIWRDVEHLKRYKAKKFRSVKGIDTETLDGQAYLICCGTAHTSKHQTHQSDEFMFTRDPYDFFDFILRHGSHSITWCFNLPFDMSACLKGRLVAKARSESNEAALEEFQSQRMVLTSCETAACRPRSARTRRQAAP